MSTKSTTANKVTAKAADDGHDFIFSKRHQHGGHWFDQEDRYSKHYDEPMSTIAADKLESMDVGKRAPLTKQ